MLPFGGCKLYNSTGSVEPPKKEWNARPPKVVPGPLPANVFRQMEYLHSEGKTDPEIAKELNIGISSVYRWRKKNNLESNYHRK